MAWVCILAATGLAADRSKSTSPQSDQPAVSKSEAVKRWKEADAAFKKARKQKEFDAAVKAVVEAAEWARGMDPSDIRQARAFYEAGHFLKFLRAPSQAIPFFEEALRVREAQAGKKCWEVGWILAELAEAEAETKSSTNAVEHADPALAIIELQAGAYADETGDVLNSCAIARISDGRVAEAREFALRALAIYEKPLARFVPTDMGVEVYNRWADPQEVAKMLNNLALIAICEEDASSAETLLRRALKLVHKRLGKGSVVVVFAESNLGRVLLDADRPREAMECFERALAAGQKELGKQNPFQIITKARIFLARGLNGAWGSPDEIKQAIDELEPLLPPSSAMLAWPRAVRAVHLLKQGGTEDAVGALRELLATNEQGEDGGAVFVARHLVRLAAQLEKEGRLQDAAAWVDWAFSLARPNLGPHSPQWDSLLAARGRLLIQQAKMEQAVKALRDRVVLLDRADAGSGKRLATALEDLAAALAKSTDASEAPKLLERASQLRAAPAKKR